MGGQQNLTVYTPGIDVFRLILSFLQNDTANLHIKTTKRKSRIIDLSTVKKSIENIKNEDTEISEIFTALPGLQNSLGQCYLWKSKDHLSWCYKTEFSFSCFNIQVFLGTWWMKFIILLNTVFLRTAWSWKGNWCHIGNCGFGHIYWGNP